MLNFDNKVLWIIEPFGVEIWITETIFNTWIIMAVLIVGALILRHLFFKGAKTIPEGLQNVVEIIVETMESFAKSVLGDEYLWLDSWFFGVLVFIVCSNLAGLVNLRNPTADVATTLALSFSTFTLVHVLAFKANPKKYLKGFVEPFFVFLPMNLIGDLAIIVSLGFRLFGNILAGLILMGLVYGMLPRIATFVIPAALHAYFDVFAGLLQAYIFVMLSMSFIKNKVSDD